jgi:hypothetical protein
MTLDQLIEWHDSNRSNVSVGLKTLQDLVHDRIQRDAMRATNRLARWNMVLAAAAVLCTLLATGVQVWVELR